MVFLTKFLLCVTVALALPPEKLAENLAQAEKLFQSGDWQKARQAYKDVLDGADATPLPSSFFYDYGTAIAKAGAPGEAYVTLLRAAYSAPFDSDVKHNLRLVEAQVPAATLGVQPAAWHSWWPSSLRPLPWQLWAVLAFTCSAAAFLLARLTDRAPLFLATALSVTLLTWTVFAWAQARLPVLGFTSAAKVKTGPAATFSDVLTLEPGSLVNEETMRDGWLKIRFLRPGAAEETVGWVEPGAVLRIY